MRRLRLLLAIGLVAALGTGTAHAQFDHLKCYKVRDPAKFVAAVSLQALQAQFGLENCRLSGKAALFCIPVNKTVTTFIDKTKTALVSEAFPGQKLEEDRLCYKLKCPNVDIPDIGVVDQFGTRPIGKFKPVFLCTPARKGVIDQPEECADKDAPHCNGLCRDPVQKCRPTGPPPADCSCQDPPHPPCNASAPTCNGDCPIAGDVCRPTADGTCGCTTPPTACSGSFPACNGDCPPGSKCLASKAAGKCDCFGIASTCQNAIAPACGAPCPFAGQQCVNNPAIGRCVCQFPHP